MKFLNDNTADLNLLSVPSHLRKTLLIKCGLAANEDVITGDDDYLSRMRKFRRDSRTAPQIRVGTGTCGVGAGATKVLGSIRKYLSNRNIKAKIKEVGCIGLCSSEPIMEIQLPGKNRIMFECVRESDVESMLDAALGEDFSDPRIIGQVDDSGDKKIAAVPMLSDHDFFKPQMRIALENCGLIDPADIHEAISIGGYGALLKAIHTMTPREVCASMIASGLKGRGGGGFPTGRKWELALETESDAKYMICNADEGDPGAFMDRAIIEGDPHRVIEGLAIAAYAIGAKTAYIYIRTEYPLAIDRLECALRDAKEMGFIGDNIFDSGFGCTIKIKQGAGAFVCGEETALIHSIEGKRGMPRPRPPYPVRSGLFGKPTVINNVETLANIATIINRGASEFAKVGTEKSKGTKVFALSGRVQKTGLIEVPMGTKLSEIVFNIGGGCTDGHTFKAVQIGGPSGGCIPSSQIDIVVDYESLKTLGAMMGSGGLVVMDDTTCMVDVAKFFMDFIQRESCGKCIPCREGTKRMLEILNSIARGRRSEKGSEALERFQGIMYLNRLAEVIKSTSLCGLGQSAPNPVLSTLKWFKDEYEAHIFERRCPAQVCTDLITFTIDEALCKGCTICTKKCPSGAIKGAIKSPHYIVQEKCIGCGACKAACKFNAILVS